MSNDQEITLQTLKDDLMEFAQERDWEQFHSPKNLAMAMSVEASEVLEHFQWLSELESKALDPEATSEIADELADVFLYLIKLSAALEVDLLTTAKNKIEKNRIKYPVSLSKGNAKKYSKLSDK